METIFQPNTSEVRAESAGVAGLTLTEKLLVRRTLVAALGLGVIGDAMMREGPRGVGFTLFTLATLGALALLMKARRAPWTLGACLLLVPTLFFAAVFSWRSSDELTFFNLLALTVAMAALSAALLRGEEWEPVAPLGDYLRGGRRVALSGAFGAARLVRDAEGLRELSAPGRLRTLSGIGRGAVLALPLLFLFGSLLTAADPVFARLVDSMFDFDFDTIVSHLVMTAFVTWIAAGYLRSSLFGARDAAHRAGGTPLALGAVEVAVVLGALDVLFLGFVVVQMRYLFGGDAHVIATAGVSYAEYARSGFFELVWVTVLVLPMLIVGDALLRPGDRAAQVTFRLLAATLLVLLAVVMISAMERMWLYQRAYGLTGTRVYASAAMVWLALVFAWFSATVLRGRRAPFAFGGLVSAWIVLAALDVANPDALIARTNIARMERGERFDALYLTQLSADATPQVVEALPTVPEKERCVLVNDLLGRLHAERDWRTWSVSRSRAEAALARHSSDLEARRCAPEKPVGTS